MISCQRKLIPTKVDEKSDKSVRLIKEEKMKLLFQAVQILKNAMHWNDSEGYGVIRENV